MSSFVRYKIIKQVDYTTLNNFYSKKLTIKEKEEKYTQNKLQIECIKKVLTERADVPESLINWLIQSVKENTILELEYHNLKIKNVKN